MFEDASRKKYAIFRLNILYLFFTSADCDGKFVDELLKFSKPETILKSEDEEVFEKYCTA